MFGLSHCMFESPREALVHWMQKVSGMGHICVLIPMMIMWAIWEARNKAKFDETRMSQDNIFHRIVGMVEYLVKGKLITEKHWRGQTQVASSLNYRISMRAPRVPRVPRVIRWHRPVEGSFKLNSDGAIKGTTGIGGGGFIIRNTEGICIFASRSLFGRVSPMEAEIRALAEGLDFCNRMNIRQLEVEFDSRLIEQLINYGKGHWSIVQYMDRIRAHFREDHLKHTHIYREANSAADYLANHAIQIQGNFSMPPLPFPTSSPQCYCPAR